MRQLALRCLVSVGLLLGSAVVFLLSGLVFTVVYSFTTSNDFIEAYSVVDKVRWAVSTAVPIGLLLLLWYWLRRHVTREGDSADTP